MKKQTVYLVVIEDAKGQKGVLRHTINHGTFWGQMDHEVLSKEQAESAVAEHAKNHPNKKLTIKEIEL